MEENRYFERDKEGNLLPVISIINTRNNLIKIEIDKLKLIPTTDLKTNRVIELLEEEYQKSGEDLEIQICPLLHFEHKLISKNNDVDLEGKPTQDQEAAILAKKLISPKYTYEQLRDFNDITFKNKVIEEIYKISFPKLVKVNESLKKAIAQLG